MQVSFSAHGEVGDVVKAAFVPHDGVEQVAVVPKGRDPQHTANIFGQVVGEQLRSKLVSQETLGRLSWMLLLCSWCVSKHSRMLRSCLP